MSRRDFVLSFNLVISCRTKGGERLYGDPSGKTSWFLSRSSCVAKPNPLFIPVHVKERNKEKGVSREDAKRVIPILFMVPRQHGSNEPSDFSRLCRDGHKSVEQKDRERERKKKGGLDIV